MAAALAEEVTADKFETNKSKNTSAPADTKNNSSSSHVPANCKNYCPMCGPNKGHNLEQCTAIEKDVRAKLISERNCQANFMKKGSPV